MCNLLRTKRDVERGAARWAGAGKACVPFFAALFAAASQEQREGRGGRGAASLPLLLVSHHYVVVSAALRALNSDPKFRPDLELCWHACVWPGAVGVANKLSTHLMHKINAPPWQSKPKTHTHNQKEKKRKQTKQKGKRKRKLQRTFCHGA